MGGGVVCFQPFSWAVTFLIFLQGLLEAGKGVMTDVGNWCLKSKGAFLEGRPGPSRAVDEVCE